jgi:hypothetical protein
MVPSGRRARGRSGGREGATFMAGAAVGYGRSDRTPKVPAPVSAMSRPRRGPGRPPATEHRPTITRDDGWLDEVLAGTLPSAIARRDEVDARTVVAGVERALARLREAAVAGKAAELLRRLGS